MKNEYKDLMINAGWKPGGRYEGRRQEFTQDLGDRSLTVFATLAEYPEWLIFEHGAGVSFKFFSKALEAAGTGLKKKLFTRLIRILNDNPMHFEQEGVQEFIQEQTERLIAWAESIDPVAEVMVIAYQNKMHMYDDLELIHRVVALALLGDVEELGLYIDDYDSERFKLTYRRTKREILVKSLELAKSGELSWAPWQRPRLEEWKGKDLSHIDHTLKEHWTQVKFAEQCWAEQKARKPSWL